MATTVKRLDTLPDNLFQVHMTKPGNFTAEVRRLARSLWRDHVHAVTPTCFRHQWSADVNYTGEADAASRGLEHRSVKTRKYCGTARQAQALGMPCTQCEFGLTCR